MGKNRLWGDEGTSIEIKRQKPGLVQRSAREKNGVGKNTRGHRGKRGRLGGWGGSKTGWSVWNRKLLAGSGD